MANRERSASELVDELADMADQVQKATVREVRKYLGKALQEMTIGTPKAEQQIRDCMQAPDFEPSEDFIAGLRFAAELVADREFDY